MLTAGSVIQSRYLVEEFLARGGMSEVYRARDQRLGTEVAVKCFAAPSDADPAGRALALQAFRQEATLQASLSHPRFPRVIDFISEGDAPCLVMDLVRGETLYQRILEAPPIFRPDWMHPWTDQMLDALDYLHGSSGRVVLRDFKPSNLMVTDAGDLAVVDLGLAVSLASPGTTPPAGLCTPGFAAPELYGIGEVDRRTDVYSLGATLYFCWTQQVPPDALSRGFKQVPTIPPSAYNPTIPPAVEQAILRAMELDPDRRFLDVPQMRKALFPEGASASVGVGGESGPAAVLPTVQAPVVSFSLIGAVGAVGEVPPRASIEPEASPDPSFTIQIPPFWRAQKLSASWQAMRNALNPQKLPWSAAWQGLKRPTSWQATGLAPSWKNLRFRVACYLLVSLLLASLGFRYTASMRHQLEDELLATPKAVASDLDAHRKQDEAERARLAQEKQEQERQAQTAYAQYQMHARRALEGLNSIDGVLDVGCNYQRFHDMVSCLNTEVRRLKSAYEGRAESRYKSYRGICDALDSYTLALSFWRLRIETSDDDIDREARHSMQKCWRTAHEFIDGVKAALNTGQEN